MDRRTGVELGTSLENFVVHAHCLVFPVVRQQLVSLVNGDTDDTDKLPCRLAEQEKTVDAEK
jgi:hypothetical protein